MEAVPADADVYLLRHVIHDWDDEDAAVILRNCAEAMQPDGSAKNAADGAHAEPHIHIEGAFARLGEFVATRQALRNSTRICKKFPND